MSKQDAPRRAATGETLTKSIFPTFPINVPMPKDTAVPGSFANRPTPPAPAPTTNGPEQE